MKKKVWNIGNTDENADWIKTSENRESEARIHDELAKQLKAQRAKKSTAGGSDP